MSNDNGGFYVMAFVSANHSIQTEKKAKELFRVSVIPTPRELTNDCGLALKFLDRDISAIKTFRDTLTVPSDLYFLSGEKINGKRKVERL